MWGSTVPIPETKGGLGQSTYTTGDILYSDASNSLAKLAVGSDTEVLKLASGIPSWASSGSSAYDWTVITTVTADGSLSYTVTSGLGTAYDEYIVIFDMLYGTQNGAHTIGFSIDGGSTYTVQCYGVAIISSGTTDKFDEGPILLSVASDVTDPVYGYVHWKLNKLSTIKPIEVATIGKDTGFKPAIKRGIIDTTSDIDALNFVGAKAIDSGTWTVCGR